jgi:hypothetical protein
MMPIDRSLAIGFRFGASAAGGIDSSQTCSVAGRQYRQALGTFA